MLHRLLLATALLLNTVTAAPAPYFTQVGKARGMAIARKGMLGADAAGIGSRQVLPNLQSPGMKYTFYIHTPHSISRGAKTSKL